MKSKIQKLRRLSLDELRVRGSQAVNALLERQGLLSPSRLMDDSAFSRLFDKGQFGGRFPSTQNWVDYFCTRTKEPFFASFIDSVSTVNVLRRHWPKAEQEIIHRADRVCDGVFDLLAFKGLSFGSPIDWHLEPVAGKSAPLIHWSKLNYLDADRYGDKKITWELNRHQYFIVLGQAYWLTGDERYAQTFANHVDSWIEQNPPKLGINWASSLEVAFRSISWLWALNFFKDSPVLTNPLFVRVLKVLYLNARHLEKYLSTYFSPNTHLTGEALGLFYLGTSLTEFIESSRWRNTGLQILLGQLDKHVQPDGVYFEQSSYYHRYTTDFYIHLSILLGANNQSIPNKLTEKLQLLLDHLMFITRPDGTTPLFGDDDGGRLLPLDGSAPNDFRSTLSTGASLFERADYKFVAGGIREESLWLVGPDRLEKALNLSADPPAQQSKGFADGGYYVMRDGWESDSNYLLFDCGPHGVNNCGHAHADALSFEMAARGRTLLVDPGTCTYTGSKDLRDWFRSSEAHNTLTVDGESSSKSAGPFSWTTIARSHCSSWITNERFDYVEGSQDGFAEVNQTRSILFLKHNYWVVRDSVKGEGLHDIKAHYHFDSSAGPLHSNGNNIRVFSENGHRLVLQIAAFAPSQGQWSEEKGWVSHCYGKRKEAPAFAFSVVAKDSVELVTFLLPEVAVNAKPIAREIEALQGQAFEVNFDGMHDVVMMRDKTSGPARGWVQTVRFASDFSIAWARFRDGDARIPEELILIDGYSLDFEGRTLLRSTKRIPYLAAIRQGDRFKVETEDGVLEIDLPVTDLQTLLWPEAQQSGE